ncbi:MAG TPA: ABC transporter substrate-binding protein, partial [Spirochaetia bacterium]|nr:ABC transporter substrate-binding protein [Spirochaetia bacterium]
MRNLRRTVLASVLGLLAFSVARLSAAPLPSEIKVGAVETLTGDNSAYGVSIRKGLELALSEINAGKLLGAAKIRLIFMDDKADKQEGISVFSRLIDDEKVSAIIGPTLSSTAFAADPVAQKAGVPVLATSNTATGITAMGNFIFRDSLLQSGVIPGSLAAVAARFHPRKAALLYEATNEYSKSEAEVFKAALQKLGIQLVATESYSRGDADFRTQLSKLNARRPDIFVVSSLVGEAIPVLQQAREIGIVQPIVGGNGFNSPNVLRNAKAAAEGLIVGSAWFIDSTAPKSRAFVAAFRKMYSADPDQFAAQAYDAMHILAAALKKVKLTGDLAQDRAAVQQALPTVKWTGATGAFAFRRANDKAGKPAG